MDFVYHILSEQLNLPEAEIESRLGALEIIPFEYNGTVTGCAVLAGCEIHFVAHPEHKGRCGTRKELFGLFSRLLDTHPYLTTRIPIETPKKDRTGERLGFTWTWHDGKFDYYVMTELPYARRKKNLSQP